jgi:DNA-binding PadR family transcriptional regulator
MARSTVSECACSGCNLERLLAPSILACLATESLHGYEIAQRLSAMPMHQGEPPDNAGVYRQLRSMESKGFVVAHWESGGSGPARRQYRLTPDGLACLKRWAETLAAYQETLVRLRGIIETVLKEGNGSVASRKQ